MANLRGILGQMMEIHGTVAAWLVDGSTGTMLGSAEGGATLLEDVAANNTKKVQGQLKALDAQGFGHLEDVLLTLDQHYHIIRPLIPDNSLFAYLIQDRRSANLAMTRHLLTEIGKRLEAL